MEALAHDTSHELIGGGTAVFNADRTHRYLLTRTWQPDAPRITFVMLNPSTADAFNPDPTITRVIGFARREGYGSVAVVNLFGLRSTDPLALRAHANPVGERNDEHIDAACPPGRTVVVAWGFGGGLYDRGRIVAKTLAGLSGIDLRCLGLTKAGEPCHPLYLRATTPLVRYRPAP